MSHPIVTRDTSIEDLVRWIPESIGYLRQQGIRCIRCGEPIWGTLAEAALEKGFTNDDVNRFVEDLNALDSQSR